MPSSRRLFLAPDPHTSVYQVVTGRLDLLFPNRPRKQHHQAAEGQNQPVRRRRSPHPAHWRSHLPSDGLYRPCSLIALRANQHHSTQLAGDEDAGGVGCNGRCAEWEIDSTVLRPEPRLDCFDGARGLTGIGADAVVLVHQTRCATHEPGRMFRTGSDASARADTGVGVNNLPASAQRGQ